MAESVILVFCKAPIPGQVKTRLLPALTAEEAAQLHAELALKTLEKVTHDRLYNVQLWCSPTTEHPFFQELKKNFPVELKLQLGADLGERMHHAFCATLPDYERAVLIGCDCPPLTRGDLGKAFSYLSSGSDCVLTPAEDGGYVLIGLTKPIPKLFAEIPWGTNQVCSMTRSRLKALGITYQELAQQWDLDTVHDLNRYRNSMLS